MVQTSTHLALFSDINPTSEAIDQLREMGLKDDQMSIMSGVPFSDKMLGRPQVWTNLPRLAISGAVVGFLASLALNFGTPYLYPIRVGGQPIFPIPTTIVITFELTMLGLMAATFLGVLVESVYTAFAPKEYVPEIANGKIGLVFSCPDDLETKAYEAMKALGAESVQVAEAKKL